MVERAATSAESKRVSRKGAAKGASKSGARSAAAAALKGVMGEVRILPLARFKPNSWNPNRMTDFQFRSLKVDMGESGWPASEALLVWGKDDKGVVRDVIINGEHRWRAAGEIGMTSGPVAVLDGLTEKQAKEWTIKLDNKRGSFDREALSTLVREISVGSDPAKLAVTLGFDDAAMKSLLEGKPSHAPGEFREVTIDAKCDYKCPKCAYEWSGKAK